MTGRCQRCEAILVPRDRYCPACGAQVAQLYSTAPTALIPPVAPNGLSPSHGRTGWPPAAIVMAVVASVILFASLAAALSRDPAGKAGQPVAQLPPASPAGNPDVLACRLMPAHTQPVARILSDVGSRTAAVSDVPPVLKTHAQRLRYNADAAVPGGSVQRAAYALSDAYLRLRVDLLDQATSAVTSDVASVASLMEQLDGSCTAVGQGLRS